MAVRGVESRRELGDVAPYLLLRGEVPHERSSGGVRHGLHVRSLERRSAAVQVVHEDEGRHRVHVGRDEDVAGDGEAGMLAEGLPAFHQGHSHSLHLRRRHHLASVDAPQAVRLPVHAGRGFEDDRVHPEGGGGALFGGGEVLQGPERVESLNDIALEPRLRHLLRKHLRWWVRWGMRTAVTSAVLGCDGG